MASNGNGRGPGRPTRYSKALDEQAYKLCLLGATDAGLANFFHVCEKTINTWKLKHPGFLQAIKSAKDDADARVIESLYNRAIGYSHDDVVVTSYQGDVTLTPIIKHYPPDATSMIFWLKNRQPARWRDKQDIEHSGEVRGSLVIIRPEASRDAD